MPFTLPPKLPLACLPTPLQGLPRLSAELGVRLFVKRDDCTGAELSGNKIRKLEFVLAEALHQHATVVITAGGEQSNHCRATALAARRLGLRPYLMLRTPNGQPPERTEGNLFLDRMVGAELRFITQEQWADRDSLMAEWASELAATGELPYVIPEGASDGLGALGYTAMVAELQRQKNAPIPDGPYADTIPRPPGPALNRLGEIDAIVHASGSGGTTAGIAGAVTALGWETKVVTYAVCDDVAYFEQKIDRVVSEMTPWWPECPEKAAYEVVDDYKGIGYALSTPEELAFIRWVAETEGLILDPVYSGKAFRGLVEDLRAGKRYEPGSTIVFVHTGGIYGLFPKAREIAWG